MNLAVVVPIVLVAAFNAFVSWGVSAMPGWTARRKFLHFALIWLLPAAGAIVCLGEMGASRRRAGLELPAYAHSTGGDGIGGASVAGDCDAGGFGGDCGGGDGGGGGH